MAMSEQVEILNKIKHPEAREFLLGKHMVCMGIQIYAATVRGVITSCSALR